MRKSKKKVPIKKRKICKSDTKGSKRKKTGGSKGESGFGTLKTWSCASLVDKQAAAIVGKVLGAAEKKSRGVNLRSLTLAPEIRAKKATHAVVCRTLRFLPAIKEIVEGVALFENYPKLRASVAYVLAYEVLMGEGCKPNGPAERVVLKAKENMHILLVEMLAKSGVKTVEELVPDERIADKRKKYARVNTLKCQTADAIRELGKDYTVEQDRLLPDVLVLPPGTDLHDHPLVQDRSIILQGYGSCMSSHALAPGKKWHVLDACAAPGNKTTHLAAIMKGKGGILAIDKDSRRLSNLSANIEQAGATNVVCKRMDFLDLAPNEEPGQSVEGILVDPSCSGSGTAQSRLDYLLPTTGSKDDGHDRISRLADFQVSALEHALQFPSARRIVYSTCSSHIQENEDVVKRVLPLAKEKGFYIKDPFPSWHRKGHLLYDECRKMIRTDPEEDGMDGFFLTLFERKVITTSLGS